MPTTVDSVIRKYTPEDEAKLVQAYTGGTGVEALATEFGRTVRSITAKLAQLGVYKPKGSNLTKKREMLKSEMVAEISALTGQSEEVMESLEKATGVALKLVLEALRNKQQAAD